MAGGKLRCRVRDRPEEILCAVWWNKFHYLALWLLVRTHGLLQLHRQLHVYLHGLSDTIYP